MKSFRDAMEKWNASVIQHEEQEQRVTEQLTGLQFNISGTIPVASAFEKPFTVFIIEMTNNSKVGGHKISVTILKRYRQLLVREVEACVVFFLLCLLTPDKGSSSSFVRNLRRGQTSELSEKKADWKHR